jgi:hypothetical protein
MSPINPGLKGFYCPKTGAEVVFADCFKKCASRCMSMPMIAAMSKISRDTVDGVYHVTEILNPPQVVHLSRTREYFATPSSLVWMMFGTGFHTVMEGGHQRLEEMGFDQRFVAEKNFKAEVNGVILSGTPDLYDSEEKTLWDYKTMKGYAAKLMIAGDFSGNKYKDQLNIYRAYAYPNAERLMVEAVIKDWTPDMAIRDGVEQIEDIEVPMEGVAETKEMVLNKIVTHELTRKTGTIPPCSMDEQWVNMNPRSKNYGMPVRCKSFCPVSKVCQQYKEFLDVQA